MPSNAQLAIVADALDGKTSAHTGNGSETGYWKRIAEALEQGAGVSNPAYSDTVEGYMTRAALAAEAKWGTSPTGYNSSRQGLLKRITNAFEASGGVQVGNTPNRFTLAAANVAFDSAAMSSLKASGAVFALYDASSYSNMWQDTAGTTTQAAAGQPVGYLKNIKTAASAWHAIAPADANRPVATNGLTIAGASQQRLHTAKVGTPATLTVVAIVKNLGAVGVLGGDSGGGFVEFGHYASADAGTPNNNAGAPTYIVDGAGVASTRAALYTALTAAGAHIVQVQSVSGANLAGISWGVTPGYGVYSTGIYIPVAVLDPAHASYATALADALTVAGEIKARIGL